MNHKINNQITAKELRVVGERSENLGILPLDNALKLAKEKGLDLIEIAPNARPPVARIMNFDKFRYMKEKEERKQRQAQKGKELKSVRITPRAARNDLQIKARQVQKFLDAGHRVEISIFLRGREKANKEWARKKIEEFLLFIQMPFIITVPLKPGGRGMLIQIAKK